MSAFTSPCAEQVLADPLRDPVTGLRREALFLELAALLLAQARRAGRLIAVASIRASDPVRAAAALEAALRGSDASAVGDDGTLLVAFADLLTPGDAERALNRLAARLRAAAGPLRAAVSLFPADATNVPGLLEAARAALPAATADGLAIRFVDGPIAANAADRLRLQDDLADALVAGELAVAWRPHVRLSTGCTVAAEPVVCWRHPRVGVVPARMTMDVARDTGLLPRIGAYLLRHAVSEYLRWPGAVRETASLSLDVSMGDALDLAALAELEDRLGAGSPAAGELLLWVSESALHEHVDAVRPALARLARAGARLGLGHFGAGAGSLRCLGALPFRELAVDAPLTVAAGAGGARLCRSVVALARELRVQSTVRGIDDAEAMGVARIAGFDKVEGGQAGEAMTAEAFVAGF